MDTELPPDDRRWLGLQPAFPLEDEHVIRLRGPWRIGPAAARSAHTVRLPSAWAEEIGSGDGGTMSLARHFHRPTGLGPGDCVWLVVEGIAPAAVRLNGAPLAPEVIDEPGVWAFAVADRLILRNEVELQFSWPLDEGRTGEELEVGLVIRSADE